MNIMSYTERYKYLLQQYVVEKDEAILSEITLLGQQLLKENIQLEDLGEMHEKAIRHIGEMYPEIPLADISTTITTPFLELLIMYSLSFREQIARRKAGEENLQKLSRKMQLILDAAGDGIIGLDVQGKITFVNPSACHYFENEEEQMKQSDFKELFSQQESHQQNTEKQVKAIIKTLKDGNQEAHLDAFFVNKRKLPFAVSYVCTPFYENKSINGAVIVFRDMSDVNETLRYYAEKLQISNEELQRFAYAASHDLQEPLRAISSYTQLLQLNFGDKFSDPEVAEFFHFIVDGAEHMKKMITALLEYSRINTNTKNIQTISMQSVLDTCLASLTVTLQQTNAQIHHGALPKVNGDATLLSQLLQNLIGNALKYRQKEIVPEIFIDCVEEKDQWVFAVKDNGIGIAPQYYERIFDIFQRLHSRKEYDGTGIGLSICKKIVEWHQGRIWLESQEKIGTTFYFSLPKNLQEGGDYGRSD